MATFRKTGDAMPVPVYFNNAIGGEKTGEAGEVFMVDYSFFWDEYEWLIPAVYLFDDGLVIDVIKTVKPEEEQAFIEKWSVRQTAQCTDLPDRFRDCIPEKNPLSMDVFLTAYADGEVLACLSGCTGVWNVLLSEERDQEAARVLEGYGLDMDNCYVLQRCFFCWNESGRPEDQASLAAQLVRIGATSFGPSFTSPEPGDRISFTLPGEKTAHALEVCSMEEHETEGLFGENDVGWEYPTWCRVMTYRITPSVPEDRVSVWDTSGGDEPRKKEGSKSDIIAVGAVTIAQLAPEDVAEGYEAACSSLFFQLPEDTTWRFVFRDDDAESGIIHLFK